MLLRLFNGKWGFQLKKVGHDVWYDGQPEGYFLKESLCEIFQRTCSELKWIVDLTYATVKELFDHIQHIVDQEMIRFQQKWNGQGKIEAINNAMCCLEAAIAYKYAGSTDTHIRLTKVQKKYIKSIDLCSYETLLKAHVGKWSVRQALNLTTDSLFSMIFGLQEPLWGQANALVNVENRLK